MAKLIALALAFAFAACHGDPAPTTAGASGSQRPVAVDPWTITPETDEVPDATAAKQLADKACPRVTSPYYFRLTRGGKTSFMLGTRHLGVGVAKLPPTVVDQIKKASLVVFETPPGDEGQTDHPATGSLHDQLGDKAWTKYTSLVGEQMASTVEHATPAVALIAMMMLYEDKLSGLDGEIEQLVADAKIPTAGLESSAFQDKLLEELLDLRMLKATIAGTKDRKQIEKESLADLAEYCAGADTDPGMDERSKKVLRDGGFTDAEIKKLDEKLLDERNAAWIPQLEKLFDQGNVFVVVGSDHLIGPKGVIKTLEGKGFATARLKN